MNKIVQTSLLFIAAISIIACSKDKEETPGTPQTYRTINLTDSIFPQIGGSGSGWIEISNNRRYYSDLQKYDANWKDRITCQVLKSDSNAIVPGTYPTVSPDMDIFERSILTSSLYFTLDSIRYDLLAGQQIQIQKVNDNYTITFQNCKARSKQKSETVNVNANLLFD